MSSLCVAPPYVKVLFQLPGECRNVLGLICTGCQHPRSPMGLTLPSVFPLLWALGGLTLFLGAHQPSASSLESGTSKLSQFIKQAQIDEKHRRESEKRWAKCCAWAFAFVCCLTRVLVAIGMIAPYLNAPRDIQATVV